MQYLILISALIGFCFSHVTHAENRDHSSNISNQALEAAATKADKVVKLGTTKFREKMKQAEAMSRTEDGKAYHETFLRGNSEVVIGYLKECLTSAPKSANHDLLVLTEISSDGTIPHVYI